MHIQVEGGALSVSLTNRVRAADVERIRILAAELGPFRSLTFELSSGEESGGEFELVAELLQSLPPGQATVRGLTMEQSRRLLACLSDVSAHADA